MDDLFKLFAVSHGHSNEFLKNSKKNRRNFTTMTICVENLVSPVLNRFCFLLNLNFTLNCKLLKQNLLNQHASKIILTTARIFSSSIAIHICQS